MRKAAFLLGVLFLFLSTSSYAKTVGNLIQIKTCQDLQNINNNLAGNYQLANDIDCSATKNWNNGLGFIPIGAKTSQAFTGILDGVGYKIKGLNINVSTIALASQYSITTSTPVGLLSLASGSTIKNLKITNAFIQSNVGNAIGILAGTLQNASAVVNVHVQGAIGGTNFPTSGGMIASLNNSTISQSSGNIIINAINNTGTYRGFGGLVGYTIGATIDQSYAKGTIKTNSISAGGLISSADVGTNVSNSYSKVQINFVCDAPTPWTYIGVGGIIGTTYIDAFNPQGSVNISNSYAVGAMTASILPPGVPPHPCVPAGGISGHLIYDNPPTVTSSYWDEQTTGLTFTVGGGTGETTAQMYQESTYAAWDFNNVWTIREGDDYPHLKWEHPLYVHNCQQLQDMNNNLQGNYFLADDIDCSDTTFVSIRPFNGNLYGLGHTITGLQIDGPGLFTTINQGDISNLHITSAVVQCSSPSCVNTGILAGILNDGSLISQVTIQGTVVGPNGFPVGGLAGMANSTIYQSSANVNVTGGVAGGLVGVNNGSIDQSFSQGTVTGGYWSGGLVSINDNMIIDSYSQASVTLSPNPTVARFAGGLVGINDYNGEAPGQYVVSHIINSYAVGKVTGVSGQILGGVSAFNVDGSVDGTDYWDTQTTGQAHSASTPDANGKTTVQMQQQATFVGWDFVNTWKISPPASLNNGFPHLQWEPYTLSINEMGDGQGTVVSNPAGIHCTDRTISPQIRNQCQAQFSAGTKVTLTAITSQGSKLQWPDPACLGQNTCTVTMNNDLNYNVTFDLIANTNVHVLIIDSQTHKSIQATGTVTLTGVNRSEVDQIKDGSVDFYFLKSGKYLLKFKISGYPLQIQTMVITSSEQGKTKTITFQLHK